MLESIDEQCIMDFKWKKSIQGGRGTDEKTAGL